MAAARTERRRLLNAQPDAVGIGGALVAVLGAGFLAAQQPSKDVLVIAALLLVLAAPTCWRLSRRRFDPFEPTFLFALAYGAMFVVRPWAMIARDDYVYPAGPADVDIRAGFTPMLVLALLGGIAFVGGYALPAGRSLAGRLKRPSHSYNPEAASLVAFGFAIVGFAFFALFLISAGGAEALAVFLSGRSVALTDLLASSNKYYIFGPIILLPASIILLALGRTHRSATAIVAGCVSLAALVVVAAPTGSRSLLFPVFISGAIYHYLRLGRRPSAGVIAAMLLLALTVSAFIVTARSAHTRQTVGVSRVFSDLAQDPSRIFDPVTKREDAAEAPGLAALLSLPRDRLPTGEGTAVLVDLLARPIPRSLWPGKPTPPRQEAARALFGRHADTFLANPEFSVLLYPWLDGGPVGVCLLMMFYGMVARVLYEYTMRHAHDIVVRLIYALALPAFIGGVRDSPVDTFARIAFLVMPVLITFMVARAVAARHAGVHSPLRFG